MKYCKAQQGRVFVIRLEDGEILHEEIEKFAETHSIKAASLVVLGGADKGSKIITGPKESRTKKIEPIENIIEDTHEITGVGTIFPDANGKPILHVHISCGRDKKNITGCVRKGVKVWHVMEIVITELLNCPARRLPDSATGFELLQI